MYAEFNLPGMNRGGFFVSRRFFPGRPGSSPPTPRSRLPRGIRACVGRGRTTRRTERRDSLLEEVDTVLIGFGGSEQAQGDDQGDHATLSFPFDILFELRGDSQGVVWRRDCDLEFGRL